jgi:hypothetical protein
MKIRYIAYLIIFIALCISISCSDYTQKQKETTFPSINDVPQMEWDQLAQKKIYFGHQSVGANIISGMQEIISENPQIGLQIIKGSQTQPYTFSSPGFLHNRVGQNMDPFSKMDDFRETIEKKFIDKPDIAFFKFCFVDFDPRTDIDAIFTHYKETMAALKKNNPDIIFVHTTVPLTCYSPGLMGWIKRGKDLIKTIIGKLNLYDFSSSNLYYEKLLTEYENKEPIFDIALIESTREDGTREYFLKNNLTYYELVKDYTTDGGHLNKKGRKIIAEQLLIFLAQLATPHQ